MLFFIPTSKNTLTLLTLGAFILITTAFVLEYGFEAKPCQMCWWQRYAHWAMAGGGTLFWVVSRHKLGLIWMALLALIGMSLGIWQVLVQYKIISAPAGCGSADLTLAENAAALLADLGQTQIVMPACDQIDFTIFGLTLAAWNVLVMLSFLGLSVYSIIKKT